MVRRPGPRIVGRLGVLVAVVLGVVSWIPRADAQSTGCRSGNPLANVRDPGRFKVHSRCVSASGVVRKTRHEDDGDIDIFLKPDPGSVHLLDDGDRKEFAGALLLEVVPADQPGCRKGRPVRYGMCTGAALRTPRVGSHIMVTGPYVFDHGHGEGRAHNEIHPVWAITTR
jgi:hypothetical protein